MTSTSRLLTLLSLLQSRRDWPGGVLADRLEISHRTVRRDVERLRELGYRIHATKGPDGGYRLEAGSELPPLLFDDDQAVAIAVALRTAAVSGAGVQESAVRALASVRQVMPLRLRHRLDALEVTAIPGRRDPAAEPVSPAVLMALSAAIRARETLRFDYVRDARDPQDARDPEDAPATPAAPRRIEPHHLVVADERWYLVAWDLERDDWRTFRVDRIRPRTPNGARFAAREVPGGDVRAYVSARFKGSAAADDWPCRGSAILHLPAREVRPFAGDAMVEDLGPERCRIHLGSWSWVALAASLGRFDVELEGVHPPELAEAFAVVARRYAAAVATTDADAARQPGDDKTPAEAGAVSTVSTSVRPEGFEPPTF